MFCLIALIIEILLIKNFFIISRLIRNADGLTTIKLIRYNDSEGVGSQASSINDSNDNSPHNQQQQQKCNTPTPMDSESSEMDSSPSHDNMGATDLRK